MKIKTYPAAVLMRKAAAVENIDGKIVRLIDDMKATLFECEGQGLAAPQVGHSTKIIIADPSIKEPEKYKLTVIINPDIVYSEGVMESVEGCLSLPKATFTVHRAMRVFVKGLDIDGNPLEIEAIGNFARILQHEIDHLHGLLLLNRISEGEKTAYDKKNLKNPKRKFFLKD
ncbi:peptide deformylase [Candidatus Magnetomonas plexicatena]|uniref:peptide deformylase n=1 Tax=Candidatus Magnetomonas plexicatena TaxID=2552947 RepID=UPI001C76F3B0|nr:peptide deformylase [Nitrospirales bacterium LBB_01]